MPFQPTGPTTICRVGLLWRHHGEGLGQQAVPFLGGQLVVRLVEQLECQLGRKIFVMFAQFAARGPGTARGAGRDGPPARRRDGMSSTGANPPVERLADGPIDAIEELRIDPEGRLGVRRGPTIARECAPNRTRPSGWPRNTPLSASRPRPLPWERPGRCPG